MEEFSTLGKFSMEKSKAFAGVALLTRSEAEIRAPAITVCLNLIVIVLVLVWGFLPG